jgi:hypothetical protein
MLFQNGGILSRIRLNVGRPSTSFLDSVDWRTLQKDADPAIVHATFKRSASTSFARGLSIPHWHAGCVSKRHVD